MWLANALLASARIVAGLPLLEVRGLKSGKPTGAPAAERAVGDFEQPPQPEPTRGDAGLRATLGVRATARLAAGGRVECEASPPGCALWSDGLALPDAPPSGAGPSAAFTPGAASSEKAEVPWAFARWQLLRVACPYVPPDGVYLQCALSAGAVPGASAEARTASHAAQRVALVLGGAEARAGRGTSGGGPHMPRLALDGLPLPPLRAPRGPGDEGLDEDGHRGTTVEDEDEEK